MPLTALRPLYKILGLLAVVSQITLWALTVEAQSPLVSLTEKERNWLSEHPTLRLGVGIAFPPYMWVEKKNGQYLFKGMVADYVNLLSERLGVEMRIAFGIPFNEALAQDRAGQIDFFPCLSKTPVWNIPSLNREHLPVLWQQ